jgi:hypothetical protein
MNSPLEIREVRLRGLHRCHSSTNGQSSRRVRIENPGFRAARGRTKSAGSVIPKGGVARGSSAHRTMVPPEESARSCSRAASARHPRRGVRPTIQAGTPPLRRTLKPIPSGKPQRKGNFFICMIVVVSYYLVAKGKRRESTYRAAGGLRGSLRPSRRRVSPPGVNESTAADSRSRASVDCSAASGVRLRRPQACRSITLPAAVGVRVRR